eukprot:5432780-Pyramimonas_sp.AAC.1
MLHSDDTLVMNCPLMDWTGVIVAYHEYGLGARAVVDDVPAGVTGSVVDGQGVRPQLQATTY